MLARILHIGLALYLVLGVSGLAPVLAEAVAGVHAECCSDCDDPDCPEQHGQECPPQCDECVCPTWVAPQLLAAVAPDHPRETVAELAARSGEVTHDAPPLRGVFRPPR